jgi:hypothetical protein
MAVGSRAHLVSTDLVVKVRVFPRSSISFCTHLMLYKADRLAPTACLIPCAQRSFLRNFLMHGFHFFVRTLGVKDIRDTQCGFKVRLCFPTHSPSSPSLISWPEMDESLTPWMICSILSSSSLDRPPLFSSQRCTSNDGRLTSSSSSWPTRSLASILGQLPPYVVLFFLRLSCDSPSLSSGFID